jgi:hypothetical protein
LDELPRTAAALAAHVNPRLVLDTIVLAAPAVAVGKEMV